MCERILRLQVIGGLGSRLRTAIGGLAYCQSNNRRLVVNWPFVEKSENRGLFDCAMSDLYTGEFDEEGRDDHHWTGVKDPAVLADNEKTELRLRTDKLDPFAPYIASEGYWRAFWSLEPTDALAQEIMRVMWPSPRPVVVGVLIRCAIKAQQCADVAWYLDRLSCLEEMFGREFIVFLSCDDRSVLDRFRARFDRRLLTTPKTFVYDKLGITRQCADAHHLRCCNWVIGANHSSFSQHVALIHGAKWVCDSNYAGHVRGGNYEDASVLVDIEALKHAMRT
jgi:hypothetical protein